MSVNRKLTGSNGRMPLNSKSGKSNEASNESNSSLRKCKKKKPYFVWGFLGVVSLGIVWFFISSHSDSFLLRKGKRLGDCEERARILLQRHNISKKQLHAFVSFFSVSDQSMMQILSQCIDERRVQKLLSSDLGNNLQMIFSGNREFHKEHTGVTGQIELMEQCPVDSVQRNLESLLLMEKTVSLAPYSAIMSNFVNNLLHGKKTFGEYTERTSFERPLTSGVAYALKVLHSDRGHFEKQHGWTIKKMEAENETLVQDCIPEDLNPAPIQDEYAPVIFAQETVSHIVSIDMMSGKEDRENILRARATGKGVLTSPFKLLKSSHLGVVLTFAVYSANFPPNATPEQRIEAAVGYFI